MSFREYPFVPKKTGQRDPGHKEVLEYLKDEFRIGELVRFETEVNRVWLREMESGKSDQEREVEKKKKKKSIWMKLLMLWLFVMGVIRSPESHIFQIECAHEDGTISFPNGFKIVAHIILHCTGYKYHFPFLDTKGIVTVDDNRVGPLYKHVFPPSLAPWLSFAGLPFKIAPFPQFELQSKWIAV